MAEVIRDGNTFFYPWNSWSAEMAQRTLALAAKQGVTKPTVYGGLDIVFGDGLYMRINPTDAGVEGWYGNQSSPDLQRLASQAVYGEV